MKLFCGLGGTGILQKGKLRPQVNHRKDTGQDRPTDFLSCLPALCFPYQACCPSTVQLVIIYMEAQDPSNEMPIKPSKWSSLWAHFFLLVSFRIVYMCFPRAEFDPYCTN